MPIPSNRYSVEILIVILSISLVVASCSKKEEEEYSSDYQAVCQGPPLGTVELREKALTDGYAINRSYDCIDKASFVAVAEEKSKLEAIKTSEAIAKSKAEQAEKIAEVQAIKTTTIESNDAAPLSGALSISTDGSTVAHIGTNGGNPRIFIFNGSLEPIAEIKSGIVALQNYDLNVNYDFHNRGQFYYLYSHGRQIGSVVTTVRFNCAVHQCPNDIPARYIPLSNTNPHPFGIATNFPLPEKQASNTEISTQQKEILWKMAKTWINSSSLSEKGKTLFLEKISQPTFKPTLDVGQLAKDGKIFLVGNWATGSMNDQHYGAGGDDDFYESLLIIAEQQQDGIYKLAKGSGSIAGNGCGYTDHVDIDGNGTDELVLGCEQLEGSSNYELLQRIEGDWKEIGMGVPVNVKIMSATIQDQKIAGATVTLQKNGAPFATTLTDLQGQGSLYSTTSDDPSTFLLVTKSGYSTLKVNCPCDGRTYAVSPVMNNLGIRIVLNWGGNSSDLLAWGANSLDLDPHLIYPDNHVFFNKKLGSDASHDVDDAASRTRTITISRRHDGARYVYAVQNYSARNDPSSDKLMNSGAKVFVYAGQTLLKTYSVPSGRGNLWEVFAITEAGEFRDINLMRGGILSADDLATTAILKH